MGLLDETAVFECHESAVRSYCRSFPTVFASARGATLTDTAGRNYIDFLAGAGTLNYGHNHPAIKQRVIEYLSADGVVHSLDLHTTAKQRFIEEIVSTILRPRGLDYRMAFPGPTGANAVELALKFARRATGRHNVIAFTNAYHGMSQGALAVSGTRSKRAGAGMPLSGVTRVPYDGYVGDVDTSELLEKMLDDAGSGVDMPAAIILETIQGEGGLNCASAMWLRRIRQIATRHDIILIVDDIQAGCGRSGTFFSFEPIGITPDIVCLSKAIGGMGMPMALVLVKEELDVLSPGQHNGTFRGNNLAFIAGAAALELWQKPSFEARIQALAARVSDRLASIVDEYPEHQAQFRGRGLLCGIGWSNASIAGRVSKEAFARGLIIETSGVEGQVLKLMPPLTISDQELDTGLDIIHDAIAAVVGGSPRQRRQVAELAAENAAV